MKGAALQRFAILIVLFGWLFEIYRLLQLEIGSGTASFEILYLGLLIGIIGLVIELAESMNRE
ncbi:hypothetical protein U3A55_05850 [Salarchaeum sp. III]|uniref:hypothetical protein n=1 Tax=Salarchaeum sp. III TaxID=3107927 RepID=UPI002ED92CCB